MPLHTWGCHLVSALLKSHLHSKEDEEALAESRGLKRSCSEKKHGTGDCNTVVLVWIEQRALRWNEESDERTNPRFAV